MWRSMRPTVIQHRNSPLARLERVLPACHSTPRPVADWPDTPGRVISERTRLAASELAEVRLAARVAVHLGAVDERPLRPPQHVKRIARPKHQVGILARLDGAEPIVYPGDPGWVDGQRPQSGVAVKPVLDGERGLVNEEIDRHDGVVGRDRDRDAR